LKSFIKEYFVFSRREQRGIIFLLILILLLFLILFILRFSVPDQKTDYTQFEAEIKAFETLQAKETTVKQGATIRSSQQNNVPVKTAFFYFDPNKTSEAEWFRLGLKKYQVKTIRNYLDKGGKFYKKNDLKKIYGINDTLFQALEPYILIEYQQEKFNHRNNPLPNVSVKKMIEINSADSVSLCSLQGIGPAFSKRIIKYRNLLGGFYKKEQLLEVYGLDSALFHQIEKQIEIDPSMIKKFDLNTVKAEELKNHPYFKYNFVKAIINFREQHGDFKNLSQIKQSDLVNDELYLKIVPYLSLK
jgi:competence protein ComEA